MIRARSRTHRLARSPVFWLVLLGVVLLGCGIFQIAVSCTKYK